MSTKNIRCSSCRGQKQVCGLGCIMKECPACKGNGYTVVVQDAPKTSSPGNTAIFLDMVSEKSASKPVAPTKNKKRTKSSSLVREDIPAQQVPKVDALMEAVLAEPGMKPEEWQITYRNVPGLFGKDIATGAVCEAISKVQRVQMRAQYAGAQPKIKRKVDMIKSQDISADLEATSNGN